MFINANKNIFMILNHVAYILLLTVLRYVATCYRQWQIEMDK